MKNIITGLLMLLSISTIICSCNSGGGGTGNPVQPTRAIIKLSVQGATTSTISGLQATLHLPAGVSVKATASAPETDSGVVSASGAAAAADLVLGAYSASRQTVTVHVVKSSGLGVGEFATIICDIARGNSPKPTDFSISDVSVWDTNGALITGMSASLTATIK